MPHLLTIVILLPFAGTLALVAYSFAPPRRDEHYRWIALVATIATFVLSLFLLRGTGASGAEFRFEESINWIGSIGARYHVAVDGVSLWLVLLTTLLMPIALLSSWTSIKKRPLAYYAFLLILESAMIGVFVSLDLLLFYLFFEASLVPMFFLIGIWGGERRIYAAIKFFIYTSVGSLLMLVGIIALYFIYHTFDYPALIEAITASPLAPRAETALFWAFAIAFFIKVPLFPVHTWLPDAHTEAPTAGSVILAGVLLKMGTYGLLRFNLALFPNAAKTWAPLIIILAVIGIIYGALVAMVQPDVKRLVAYSSVSHMGFVVLGLFSFTELGMQGALYQMLNHGVSTGALFLFVGFIYDRRHTRLISEFGGLATPMPWFSTLFVIASLSSIGLPFLNGFVGEFLILIGTWTSTMRYSWITTMLAATGVIWAAVYMLWMLQRVVFGEVTNPENAKLTDLDSREVGLLLPLMILMLFMGVYPRVFLDRSQPSVEVIRARVNTTPASGTFTAADLEKGRQKRVAAMMPIINWSLIAPEVIVCAAAVIVMLLDAFLRPTQRWITGGISLGGLVAAAVASIYLWVNGTPSPDAFNGMIVLDELRLGFTLIFLLVSALTLLLSTVWVGNEQLPAGEFHSLLLFATVGMMLMASGNDLVIVFLGLEILSIATYVLAGFRRTDVRSNESSLKYFILGSFSSAFLLYGIALIYGATSIAEPGPGGQFNRIVAGTTNIAEIASRINEAQYPALLYAGAAMMLVGFGFKIATAPFHIWTPDVYEGAPTPVTAFMAAGPKAAGFASFMRVFLFGLPFVVSASSASAGNLHQAWVNTLAVMAILTMTIGNVVAIVQNNVKRMLAYSSIAHAGYALVGFVAAGAATDVTQRHNAISAVMFYLLTYAVMNLGAFAVVQLIARRGDRRTSIEDYSGIGFESPMLAFSLSLFMLSLLGMPLTAGFIGKVMVFGAAIDQGYYILVVVGVLNTAVSAYYYLRMIIVMFFGERTTAWTAPRIPASIAVTLALTVLGVLYLGVFPGRIINAFQTRIESQLFTQKQK